MKDLKFIASLIETNDKTVKQILNSRVSDSLSRFKDLAIYYRTIIEKRDLSYIKQLSILTELYITELLIHNTLLQSQYLAYSKQFNIKGKTFIDIDLSNSIIENKRKVWIGFPGSLLFFRNNFKDYRTFLSPVEIAINSIKGMLNLMLINSEVEIKTFNLNNWNNSIQDISSNLLEESFNLITYVDKLLKPFSFSINRLKKWNDFIKDFDDSILLTQKTGYQDRFTKFQFEVATILTKYNITSIVNPTKSYLHLRISNDYLKAIEELDNLLQLSTFTTSELELYNLKDLYTETLIQNFSHKNLYKILISKLPYPGSFNVLCIAFSVIHLCRVRYYIGYKLKDIEDYASLNSENIKFLEENLYYSAYCLTLCNIPNLVQLGQFIYTLVPNSKSSYSSLTL